MINLPDTTKKKLTWVIKGIGPFNSRTDTIFFSGNKFYTGIYALNGIGKTFISRLFSVFNGPDLTSDIKLLKEDEPKGFFEIKWLDENEMVTDSASLEIVSSGVPTVTKHPGSHVFHVFNSDYVRKMFYERQYDLYGNIEGEIALGKDSGAVVSLQDQLVTTNQRQNEIEESIKSYIDAKKAELVSHSVARTTSSYAAITFESVFNQDLLSADNAYAASLARLDELKDDIQPIQTTPYNGGLDFASVKKLLKKPVKRPQGDDEISTYVTDHIDFIKKGLTIQTEKPGKCPYCLRDFDTDTARIISLYETAVESEHAKYIQQLRELFVQLRKLQTDTQTYLNESKLAYQVIEQKSKLIGLQLDIEELAIDEQLFEDQIGAITDEITQLAKDEISAFTKVKSLDQVRDTVSQIDSYSQIMESKTGELNDRISKLATVRTEARKAACESALVDIAQTKKAEITEYNANKQLIIDTNNQIKELSAKVKKRTKVADLLADLIKMYFDDKYVLDKEKFTLRGLGVSSPINSKSVLSDGEKSIIIFCYYLASVYTLTETVEDEKKVVFIIDDPVSSMDFQFVYTTASLLKNISESVDFSQGGNSLLLFTHNTELASILTRNNIIKYIYFMESPSATLERLSEDQLLMPYYPHLKDVIALAEGKQPKHTSANSMRHVLEVLATFNCTELREFSSNIEVLAELPLLHDLSHGSISSQHPYRDVDFKNAAKAIVKYIYENHPKQIEKARGC